MFFCTSGRKIILLLSGYDKARDLGKRRQNKEITKARKAAVRAMFAAGLALGMQFRDARVAQGLTQAQLAELSGVPQADISRIERGAGNPTETTLQRLAHALNGQLKLVPA